MRIGNIRLLRNSFWLWFVAALTLNQIAVFSIFYFVLMKPATEVVTEVVGSVYEASRLIDQLDPQSGITRLQKITAHFPGIEFKTTRVKPEEIPKRYFGLQIMKRNLESRYNGTIRVGYAGPPDQGLLIQSSDRPDLTLQISFQGRYLALYYSLSSILLIIIISLGAAFWISNRLVHPLQYLSNAANKLGYDKDFRQILIPPRSSPEIVQLAETLNEMRTMLDRAIQEREDLLSSVTHDLRTPLSRIRMAIELEGQTNNPFMQRLLEDIIEMNDILEQFNELSRLNIEINEPWAQGSIKTLIQNIERKYQRAGISLNIRIDGDLPEITHKPLAMTRLLYNLIDNAYQHGCGDVLITAEAHDGKLLLQISNPVSEEDEGSGLIRSLRGKESGKTAGLGLSIVRRFTEVHGAELEESTANDIRTYTLKIAYLGSTDTPRVS